MTEGILIVDALSAGEGKRTSSRDSIGCGPRAIAGVFEKHEINCRISRIEHVLTHPKVMKRYEHLAISAMTMDYPVIARLIPAWRKNNPNGLVILGGPIASDVQYVLSTLKPDVIVIGEGEATINDLLNRGFLSDQVELADIQGIAFIRNGTTVITDPRAPIDQLVLWKEFPPSSTRVIDYRAYEASRVYVEVVRGCSNFRRTSLPLPDGRVCSECGNCDADDLSSRLICPEEIPPGCGFCSVPAVWGPPRSRPIQSIIDEITELLELGVHRIVLEAPDFLDYMRGHYPMTDPCRPVANEEEIRSLLTRIMELPQFKEGTAHLSIENMKACLFTESIAELIADALGPSSPNIGMETGSDEHSRAIGKCSTPQNVIDAIRIAKKYGMTPYVYFIYGLPNETEQTVEESLRLMRMASDAGAERIILYGFRPLPRSAFEDFPPPDQKHEFATRLRSEAARINRLRKRDLIGQIVRGIAAEPSWARHGYTMVYPLRDGPIMTVQGGYSPGSLVDVEITHVLSPGLVEGKVVLT